MSDSDFGANDEVKKHRSKKTRHADDKPKKRKRSKSFERNTYDKNYKEKKKHKHENELTDDDGRGPKSNSSKHRKKNFETPDDKNREKKRKNSPVEEELEVLKEIRDKKSGSRIRKSKEESMENSKSKDVIKKTKERRKDYERNEEDKRGSKYKYEDYEENRHKKGSSRVDESDEDTPQKKAHSKYSKNGDRRSVKNRDPSKKSSSKDRKKSYNHRGEVTDENDSSERNKSDEDEDNHSSNHTQPQRLVSVRPQRPMRKNCAIYWNKYSDRLGDNSQENTARVEIGPRYYSRPTVEQPRRDLRDRDNEREEQRGGDDDNRPNREQRDVKNGGNEEENRTVPPKRKTFDILTSRTGGAYIPPAKLRQMQENITDKGSVEFQRLAWEALKKSIQGHVNKVNVSNIVGVIKAIQKENIVRGKGLLCRALIQAQAASPTFTNVYAALVAVLNAKFPKIGELLLKRLVVQFRRGFKRNDKTICITAATFIAHLVNQEVAHEILALEILTLLIETPTDDSVEVAIAFLKECGMKLTEVASKGIMGIFDMLRNILHEGKLEKRVQYMIEVMFQIRKEDFKAHPSLIDELDLVEQGDKITHLISLEENHNPEDILNVFKFDPDYEAAEAKYKSLVMDDDDDDDDDGSNGDGSGSDDSDDESDEGAEETKEKQDVIVDKTETNLVALRKTIYLTIQSSLDFEECAHKLLKMELKPGQEIEMAHMFLDCCAEQRTYEKFYGLLSQRFCQINRSYIAPFEETFRDSYATIHRMSNDKLRNIAKLFAHLLYTDAISWEVLATIRLNEEDTTSSSRIFIKILFQELSEYMGLAKLNQRVKDPALQTALEGLFPRDNPQHTRFAINFFTSIGLGGITDELREHLKVMPRFTPVVNQLVDNLSSSSSSSSSSSDSSDSDSSSSSD